MLIQFFIYDINLISMITIYFISKIFLILDIIYNDQNIEFFIFYI